MKNECVGKVWDKKWKKLDIDEFRKNALEYDPWTFNHQQIIDKYSKKISKDGIFLEAGCGMGHWCFYVSEKYNIKSLGVDIAEDIIKNLQEKRSKLVDFVVDDLNNSKLKNNSFDMFISLGVIEHFKDSNQMMIHLHRILKPGGIGIITVPNLYSFHTITRPVLQFFGKWDIGYEKSFSPKKLKELSQKNNFKIMEYGILPSGEIFGFFLNHLPIFGKIFEKISFFIEKKQRTFSFISYVVVKKI